jgi:N-methylhydantoinase A
VPPFPGVFTALGLLLADYRFDYASSRPTPLSQLSPADVREQYAELTVRAYREFGTQGIVHEQVRFEFLADLRYAYQVDDITLPVSEEWLGAAEEASLSKELARRFRAVHEREFGYPGDGDIILNTIRLRAIASDSTFSLADLVAARASQPAPADGASAREIYFGKQHGLIRTPVLCRAGIQDRVPGPVVIEEPDTTVVVRPGWTVELGAAGELIVTR